VSYSDRIHELDDQRLAAAAAVLTQRSERLQLPMSPWESRNITGIVDAFRCFGALTFRQRKVLRLFVGQLTVVLEQRASFDKLLKEIFEQAAAL
jgi:hypothetical protein